MDQSKKIPQLIKRNKLNHNKFRDQFKSSSSGSTTSTGIGGSARGSSERRKVKKRTKRSKRLRSKGEKQRTSGELIDTSAKKEEESSKSSGKKEESSDSKKKASSPPDSIQITLFENDRNESGEVKVTASKVKISKLQFKPEGTPVKKGKIRKLKKKKSSLELKCNSDPEMESRSPVPSRECVTDPKEQTPPQEAMMNTIGSNTDSNETPPLVPVALDSSTKNGSPLPLLTPTIPLDSTQPLLSDQDSSEKSPILVDALADSAPRHKIRKDIKVETSKEEDKDAKKQEESKKVVTSVYINQF